MQSQKDFRQAFNCYIEEFGIDNVEIVLPMKYMAMGPVLPKTSYQGGDWFTLIGGKDYVFQREIR